MHVFYSLLILLSFCFNLYSQNTGGYIWSNGSSQQASVKLQTPKNYTTTAPVIEEPGVERSEYLNPSGAFYLLKWGHYEANQVIAALYLGELCERKDCGKESIDALSYMAFNTEASYVIRAASIISLSRASVFHPYQGYIGTASIKECLTVLAKRTSEDYKIRNIAMVGLNFVPEAGEALVELHKALALERGRSTWGGFSANYDTSSEIAKLEINTLYSIYSVGRIDYLQQVRSRNIRSEENINGTDATSKYTAALLIAKYFSYDAPASVSKHPTTINNVLVDLDHIRLGSNFDKDTRTLAINYYNILKYGSKDVLGLEPVNGLYIPTDYELAVEGSLNTMGRIASFVADAIFISYMVCKIPRMIGIIRAVFRSGEYAIKPVFEVMSYKLKPPAYLVLPEEGLAVAGSFKGNAIPELIESGMKEAGIVERPFYSPGAADDVLGGVSKSTPKPNPKVNTPSGGGNGYGTSYSGTEVVETDVMELPKVGTASNKVTSNILTKTTPKGGYADLNIKPGIKIQPISMDWVAPQTILNDVSTADKVLAIAKTAAKAAVVTLPNGISYLIDPEQKAIKEVANPKEDLPDWKHPDQMVEEFNQKERVTIEIVPEEGGVLVYTVWITKGDAGEQELTKVITTLKTLGDVKVKSSTYDEQGKLINKKNESPYNIKNSTDESNNEGIIENVNDVLSNKDKLLELAESKRGEIQAIAKKTLSQFLEEGQAAWGVEITSELPATFKPIPSCLNGDLGAVVKEGVLKGREYILKNMEGSRVLAEIRNTEILYVLGLGEKAYLIPNIKHPAKPSDVELLMKKSPGITIKDLTIDTDKKHDYLMKTISKILGQSFPDVDSAINAYVKAMHAEWDAFDTMITILDKYFEVALDLQIVIRPGVNGNISSWSIIDAGMFILKNNLFSVPITPTPVTSTASSSASAATTTPAKTNSVKANATTTTKLTQQQINEMVKIVSDNEDIASAKIKLITKLEEYALDLETKLRLYYTVMLIGNESRNQLAQFLRKPPSIEKNVLKNSNYVGVFMFYDEIYDSIMNNLYVVLSKFNQNSALFQTSESNMSQAISDLLIAINAAKKFGLIHEAICDSLIAELGKGINNMDEAVLTKIKDFLLSMPVQNSSIPSVVDQGCRFGWLPSLFVSEQSVINMWNTATTGKPKTLTQSSNVTTVEVKKLDSFTGTPNTEQEYKQMVSELEKKQEAYFNTQVMRERFLIAHWDNEALRKIVINDYLLAMMKDLRDRTGRVQPLFTATYSSPTDFFDKVNTPAGNDLFNVTNTQQQPMVVTDIKVEANLDYAQLTGSINGGRPRLIASMLYHISDDEHSLFISSMSTASAFRNNGYSKKLFSAVVEKYPINEVSLYFEMTNLVFFWKGIADNLGIKGIGEIRKTLETLATDPVNPMTTFEGNDVYSHAKVKVPVYLVLPTADSDFAKAIIAGIKATPANKMTEAFGFQFSQALVDLEYKDNQLLRRVTWTRPVNNVTVSNSVSEKLFAFATEAQNKFGLRTFKELKDFKLIDASLQGIRDVVSEGKIENKEYILKKFSGSDANTYRELRNAKMLYELGRGPKVYILPGKEAQLADGEWGLVMEQAPGINLKNVWLNQNSTYLMGKISKILGNEYKTTRGAIKAFAKAVLAEKNKLYEIAAVVDATFYRAYDFQIVVRPTIKGVPGSWKVIDSGLFGLASDPSDVNFFKKAEDDEVVRVMTAKEQLDDIINIYEELAKNGYIKSRYSL